ncbi:hypothetical protein [Lacticaseibacillus manihotivorans]|uniref:Uncharacterized protein n=1 Tax=Lacticaseibacillus manihotivorans TaxID=88233 RepID=A0A5P8JR88_9LACO|nr:hypothetical protein [Lacticaseibacillus manihotivorans]QFQ91777.1 hypothetical protein LM010_10235 [Lacticaseibacillus manihotivorans]
MSRTPETRAWRAATASAAKSLGIGFHAIGHNARAESLGSIVQYLMMDTNPAGKSAEDKIKQLIGSANRLGDYETYECHGDKDLEMANRLIKLCDGPFRGVGYDAIEKALVDICYEIDYQSMSMGYSSQDYANTFLEVT